MNSIQSLGKHVYQTRSCWFLSEERREGEKNKYVRTVANSEYFLCQNDYGPI